MFFCLINQSPMFSCLIFSRRALRHWPSGLRTSVEIQTLARVVRPEQIRVIAITFFNNKNGWNTSMCSSSTLTINLSTSTHYPTKKWNTHVPLFNQIQSNFLGNNPNFNNSLTISIVNSPLDKDGGEWMFFCKRLILCEKSYNFEVSFTIQFCKL